MAKTSLFESHFIPARVQKPWRERKLMVVLHGRGDSIRPFFKFHKELKMPEMNYLLINAPYRMDDGYKWCGLPPYHKRGILNARTRLFQLLDELQEQGYLAHNIFLFGFSEGCLISVDLGMSYPKRLGGIIGVSGCIHFFPRWRKNLSKAAFKTPWLFTHGSRDRVIPIEETRSEVSRLVDVGLPVDWVELEKRHEIEDQVELSMIRDWVRSTPSIHR